MHPWAESLLLAVVPRVASLWLRLLGGSIRWEYRGKESLDEARRDPGQYILAFWHSRLLTMPWAYPDRRMMVLSSKHRDAELVIRTLRPFGTTHVRGSSSEGGAAGLRALLRGAARGYDLAFTPDGPRGPRRQVQAGVVTAARLSGLPIIPVACSANPARRLRSWDRLLIPRFFARGVFLYGPPIRVPRSLDEAGQELTRLELQAALDRLTDEADRAVGLPPEDAG